MSAFYYGKSLNDHEYYFRLRDNNNETILSSTEGYQTEQACLIGIAAVKKNAPDDNNGTDSNTILRSGLLIMNPLVKVNAIPLHKAATTVSKTVKKKLRLPTSPFSYHF
jgi:uncharacterized protein YegP (UPF0339 family)